MPARRGRTVAAAALLLLFSYPLRSLYLVPHASDSTQHPAINMLLRHGVRACLEYARTGDLASARRLSNPDLSPHLSFVDNGGHGCSTVRLTGDALECEFVCIPRPVERGSTLPPNADCRPRHAAWLCAASVIYAHFRTRKVQSSC